MSPFLMSPEPYSIDAINRLGAEDFIRLVGPVFEQSSWVAEHTASRRPFSNREEMRRALCDTVRSATLERKLALIGAQPGLAGRAALAATLPAESPGELASAGLDKLTAEEIAQFQQQDHAYHQKFGFPFVICARLTDKAAILSAFERRMRNGLGEEIEFALEEIFKIAELRLRDLVSETAAPPGLTSHVLDTTRGRPAVGMQIELWRLSGDGRQLLNTVRTNADGRADPPLLNAAELRPGQYELIFFLGDYFSASTGGNEPRFLDRVPVRFGISGPAESYHIPLLCSPWAYSTCRGS
jgi:2-oxo-4-hydroxy-4-carboxy-5-ureidoimidazoline decarboxylase